MINSREEKNYQFFIEEQTDTDVINNIGLTGSSTSQPETDNVDH